MKISLSGVSNSGKTTLWEDLKHNFPKYKFIPEQIRKLKSVNQYPPPQLQEILLSLQVEAEGTYENIVADRCSLDVAAYYILNENRVRYDLVDRLVDSCRKYDMISIYTVPYEFVGDGFRVKEDSKKLIRIFKMLVKRYNLENCMFVEHRI